MPRWGAASRQGRDRCCALQRAEEFVELVSGVKISFEFAGGEAFAEIVEAAGEEIKRRGEDFLIGEDDVAPRGIGASGQA